MDHDTRAALARIERKLERWELAHLREHCAQLATQAEQLEGQLQLLQARLEHAEGVADYWHEQVLRIKESLAGDLQLGMTADGAMGVVKQPEPNPIAAEAPR